MALHGKYFDGQNSARHDMALQLDEGGLVLAMPTLFEPLPLSKIKIADRLGRLPRTLSFPSGAQFETDDHAIVDQWLAKRNKRPGWVPTLERNARLALLSAALAGLLMASGARWGLPWASGAIARALPDALSAQIGQGALTSLDGALLRDSEVSADRQAELREQFQKLLPEHDQGMNYSLQFRDGLGANALALPDGTVVVTDELIELSANDEELLAVLLHEIGHVLHRHSLQQLISHSGLAVLTSVLLGDASFASGMIVVAPSILLQSFYSREAEREADDYALSEMRRLGIHTKYFGALMQRMEEKYGDEDGVMTYLSTHPPTQERIDASR